MIESVFLLAVSDAGFLGGLLSNILVWTQVAIGIGLVIFVHELGHFVAAKTFGVKCEKFYVGFDVPITIGPIKLPRSLFKFQYGETEYGLGVVPLGGYVKMLGQDDDPRKMEEESQRAKIEGDVDEPAALDPRSFPAKPVWQRMIIISAGVVVNVITGVLFAAIAFGYGVSYLPAQVGGLVPGAPAWEAGIEPGGKMVRIGDYHEEQMPFNEMRIQIVSQAIDDPNSMLSVSVDYPDGVREFPLTAEKDPRTGFRVIGLLSAKSAQLASVDQMVPQSVAQQTLSDEDNKAQVIAFAGNTVDTNDPQQVLDLRHYLYTHPAEPITLTLRQPTGQEKQITLAPQSLRSLGFQFAPGPVTSLIKNGPAEAAGMKEGDVILAIDGQTGIDAHHILTELTAAVARTQRQSKRITVQREGQSEPIDIQIKPSQQLQVESPSLLLGPSVAINAFGFAFTPMPVVAASSTPDDLSSADSAAEQSDRASQLKAGDQLRAIRYLGPDGEMPEYMKSPEFEVVLEKLTGGWEFTEGESVKEFTENLQLFPIDSKFEIVAFRPDEQRMVTISTRLRPADRFAFDRGLRFRPPSAIRTANGIQDALQLGLAEGKRRFNDVLWFLKMLPTGQVQMKHVGGPLAIANLAKEEAEKGIPRQLTFLTMLSMNLAILNFLPIPALDGGHMVFLTYELLRGKRANEQLEMRLTIAGFLSLLALMVVVFANDIMRIFG